MALALLSSVTPARLCTQAISLFCARVSCACMLHVTHPLLLRGAVMTLLLIGIDLRADHVCRQCSTRMQTALDFDNDVRADCVRSGMQQPGPALPCTVCGEAHR
eukprot:1152779-Pelagomonas_calceolata.AAC.2